MKLSGITFSRSPESRILGQIETCQVTRKVITTNTRHTETVAQMFQTSKIKTLAVVYAILARLFEQVGDLPYPCVFWWPVMPDLDSLPVSTAFAIIDILPRVRTRVS